MLILRFLQVCGSEGSGEFVSSSDEVLSLIRAWDNT